ncbi:MAG: FGGY family carbohydrate kinase, partial [Oscillospiraceae bacterium]
MTMLLGIDVGTTGTKSTLVTAEGKILSKSYMPYSYTSGEDGRFEQNPSEWYEAVRVTVNECCKDYDKCDIKALALSTQGGTLVPVDREGNELCNAIVWMDTRAGKQGKQLKARYGDDWFYEKTGWRPGNCFNMLQILWLRENEPQIFDRTYKFLSTIDYLHFKLTGRFVIDITNACITQLFNVCDKDWDDEILSICGISRERLALPLDTGEFIGTLTEQAAVELGLNADTKVICGAQDQYIAAIGNGAFKAGDVLLSCGTSWCINAFTDKMICDKRSYFSMARHAIDGLWASMAYSPAGGAALEWFRNNVGLVSDSGTAESYSDIDRRVNEIPPGSDD